MRGFETLESLRRIVDDFCISLRDGCDARNLRTALPDRRQPFERRRAGNDRGRSFDGDSRPFRVAETLREPPPHANWIESEIIFPDKLNPIRVVAGLLRDCRPLRRQRIAQAFDQRTLEPMTLRLRDRDPRLGTQATEKILPTLITSDSEKRARQRQRHEYSERKPGRDGPTRGGFVLVM